MHSALNFCPKTTRNETIEIINNKARHNLINAKYRQMAFRLGLVVTGTLARELGGITIWTPWSNSN